MDRFTKFLQPVTLGTSPMPPTSKNKSGLVKICVHANVTDCFFISKDSLCQWYSTFPFAMHIKGLYHHMAPIRDIWCITLFSSPILQTTQSIHSFISLIYHLKLPLPSLETYPFSLLLLIPSIHFTLEHLRIFPT